MPPRNAYRGAEQLADSVTGADESQEPDQVGLTAEDAKELADPIKALMSIFKQKPKKKRAPLELNHVMNKYRQLSLRNGKGMSSKVFKEDYIASSQLSGEHEVGHESRTLLQGAQGQKSSWQQRDNIIIHQDGLDTSYGKAMQTASQGERQPYHALGEHGFPIA